jgi:hypothetical protein
MLEPGLLNASCVGIAEVDSAAIPTNPDPAVPAMEGIADPQRRRLAVLDLDPGTETPRSVLEADQRRDAREAETPVLVEELTDDTVESLEGDRAFRSRVEPRR